MINNSLIIMLLPIPLGIVFCLFAITEIEITYANHTKYHLENSFADITISGDDISDALLEDIKKNAVSELKAEQNNNASQSQPKISNGSTKAKIILTSQKFKVGENPEIVGQVKNIGNGTAADIRITYSYFDQNNDILGSEYFYLDISKLMTGQKAPFSNILTDELIINEMTHYELGLTWIDPDGSEVYMEDVNITKDETE